MSFEIGKIYTDNPYVDEMVYYTKLLSINTVLKMEDLADSYETAESIKKGDLYIACVENVATLRSLYPYLTVSAFHKIGIIKQDIIELCFLDISYLMNNKYVSEEQRRKLVTVLRSDYIQNYTELNTYYRMLHGLPPLDAEPDDYMLNGRWLPPSDVVIDIDKPIYEMSKYEISILDKYGVLDEMIEENPKNRQYIRYLDKQIDYYFARKAQKFDLLYMPNIDSEAISRMYRDKLDSNKFYVLRAVYSEAYKYNSDYYDNFIAVLIVLLTVVDIVSRVQEFIARKEIFDIRSVQYLFKSYGVPFFEQIPLKYQIAMVKNLHTLLKYKSTAKCMVDICSLFGFKNIKIFKYYLLRDRSIDMSTGDYITAFDENGNEDLDAEYELKFLKLPLNDDVDEYIKVSGNYIDYDSITLEDVTWDGGLDHNKVKQEILKEEFNLARTKYISVDTIYEIAKMSAQQTYFFNMLYDNVELESMITVKVPFIDSSKDFFVSDLFTLLTVLTHYYNGTKDMIMDTQSKVLTVNGFNFKADLARLAEIVGPKTLRAVKGIRYGDKNGTNINTENQGYDFIQNQGTIHINTTGEEYDYLIDPGSTLHAQEQLNKFRKPEASIPSFQEMMALFVNNLEVRDELIKGMQEADDKKVYDVYKTLYDSLMTVELTFDHFKNPDTGDFYREEGVGNEYTIISDCPIYSGPSKAFAKVGRVFKGDIYTALELEDGWIRIESDQWIDGSNAKGIATYSEYLKHKDSALYNIAQECLIFDDDAARNQYIANVIDSIVYALEEYIDADEFQALFANLPAMSPESVKQYIGTVINFYKSYKVDFLGLNTIYILDDKNDGTINLIDNAILERFFEKVEFVKLYNKIYGMTSNLQPKERARLIERIYLDISTWIIKNYDDSIKIEDEIYEKLVKFAWYSIIRFNEELKTSKMSNRLYENIPVYDFNIHRNVNLQYGEDLGLKDRIWIYEY